MSTLIKTLIGDLPNLALVAGTVALAALLIRTGSAHAAAYITPALLLAGAAWFARD